MIGEIETRQSFNEQYRDGCKNNQTPNYVEITINGKNFGTKPENVEDWIWNNEIDDFWNNHDQNHGDYKSGKYIEINSTSDAKGQKNNTAEYLYIDANIDANNVEIDLAQFPNLKALRVDNFSSNLVLKNLKGCNNLQFLSFNGDDGKDLQHYIDSIPWTENLIVAEIGNNAIDKELTFPENVYSATNLLHMRFAHDANKDHLKNTPANIALASLGGSSYSMFGSSQEKIQVNEKFLKEKVVARQKMKIEPNKSKTQLDEKT